MKKTVGLICTMLILAAGSSFGAQLTNVELSWQDGFTVARLDVQGPVRFSHQTEEAKDGRPFRVIVDVLSATHHLGQKNFGNLPSCPVAKIRSSQYSVTPEKVVRVVFDMNQETVYRVDSDERGVIVYFPDKQGSSFAAWSSAGEPVEKTAAPDKPAQVPTEPSRPTASQMNNTIDKDRLASLQAEPATPSRPADVETKPDLKVPKPEFDPEPTDPQADAEPVVVASAPQQEAAPAAPSRKVSRKDAQSDAKPAKKQTPPAAKPTPSKQPAAKPTPAKQPTASKTVASQPASKAPAAAPVAMAPHPTAQTPGVKAVPKAKSATTQPVSEPATKPAAQPKPAQPETGADELEEEKTPPSKQSTSRFRRSPTAPNKMKGTLVAEFPKRLVVKYAKAGRRDPFETLINEVKQNNNPVERRVPNVEGLRLVGIMQSDWGNSALFEDKDGYGYILKEGDKVQKGYVLRIKPEKVYFQIFEYGWSRTVALNLESE